VAIGVSAQRNVTTAQNNVAVGHQALFSNTAGTEITAIGHQAGYYFNGPSAINTYVGYRAGFSSTGAYNSD
jgi:hypothetical protein